MHTDEVEGGEDLQLADLFTSEDIVDRIVSSVTDNDVYMTLMYARELEKKRGARDMINSGRASFLLPPHDHSSGC